MVVYDELNIENIYDLERVCWSGAIDRIEEVKELSEEKQGQFIDYLYDNLMYGEDILTTTQLNDFIWFECDNFIEELKGEEEEEDI